MSLSAIFDGKLLHLLSIMLIEMKRFSLLLILLLAVNLLAHGVQQQVLQGGYGVQISYDDGDPMDFADVQLFRPNNAKIAYQLGSTDEQGVFMFKPDTIGTWTVRVSDGLGHGAVIPVTITDQQTVPTARGGLSRWQMLVSGVGYILFFFSVWYAFVNRRRNQHAHS